ncbi:MAG TPA: glycosyltransferase family 4 protein [Miltoncostaeaceae bacterium]|nr:glycosyltransferase family 4 protein [Miltoncostaeaceae bacterium]
MSRRGAYIVVEWSGGGGIGHYSYLLADALARAGQPAALATRAGNELEGRVPQAARLLHLWPRAPRRLSGRPRTAAIALSWGLGWLRVVGTALAARLRGRPAIVHVQAPESAPETLFLALLRPVARRLVVTAHNAVPHDRPGAGGLIHRVTYRLPHLVVAQSEDEAAVVRRLAGRRTRVGVVAHGTYRPIADAFAEPANGVGDAVRVAHLGTLRPYKGFDTVVAAFGGALRADPGLRLRVVGRAADCDGVRRMLDELPAHAVSADLRHLTVEELVSEARAADVLVLGHRRASESGILHLALAAGTPVVGPDIGGIGRLLAGQSAWLYPPADAEAAAAAILAVARATRADREGMRAAARDIAERAAPTWDDVARAHLALLRDVGA